MENDHKPLAVISCKPLSLAPKSFQDITTRNHRYDVNFIFFKGTNLHLADTLSRVHLDSSEGNQDDSSRIMNVNAFGDIQGKRLDEIKDTTSRDASLQTVIKLVLEGWTEDKRDIPSSAWSHFDLCDSQELKHPSREDFAVHA